MYKFASNLAGSGFWMVGEGEVFLYTKPSHL